MNYQSAKANWFPTQSTAYLIYQLGLMSRQLAYTVVPTVIQFFENWKAYFRLCYRTWLSSIIQSINDYISLSRVSQLIILASFIPPAKAGGFSDAAEIKKHAFPTIHLYKMI